ncbi:hypothetical protein IQ246_13565 [aff. Roholtiella sp. LEGE 12411]|nr:hypothetical protein [aff. Roholtiella sp. LEGE 12411]
MKNFIHRRKVSHGGFPAVGNFLRQGMGNKEEVTNAQCPMPNAQCPMPNAQCPMPKVGGRLSLCNHFRNRVSHRLLLRLW